MTGKPHLPLNYHTNCHITCDNMYLIYVDGNNNHINKGNKTFIGFLSLKESFVTIFYKKFQIFY